MLSIRMQRLGRKGHSMYRIVVQDSRRAPTSGKYVALLGSYDPHSKTSSITKDKAELYLKNGAQPSDRVVRLFKSEKISLPKWVEPPAKKKSEIKNPDKLRKNRPAVEKAVEPAAEEVPAASESTAADVEAPISEETSAADQDEIDKGNDETKTPPNEDEFPEDKKAEAKTK
ncbi:30S ribosomal protein S16 [Candidatus Parcubacteria bacterium]|nr:30S ribosomal protein S16 [Candidatus Parcubacteria bacterium]